MNIPAIRQAILRQGICSSFETQPTITGEAIRELTEEMKREAALNESAMQEAVRQMARARIEAIGKFAREELGKRVEGGESMDDATLIETAQASGFRVVSFVAESDEPGVESIVIYLGVEMVAGMKLRLFPV